MPDKESEMSCCGKKREAMRQRRVTPILVAPPQAQHAPAPSSTPIVFRGTGAYLITGQHSRYVYHFSQDQREQRVDAKDVAAMVQTGLFQIKS
jgi:hypothetical protein